MVADPTIDTCIIATCVHVLGPGRREESNSAISSPGGRFFFRFNVE